MLFLGSPTVSSSLRILSTSHNLTLKPQVWEQASQAIEIAQGKAIADASVAAGVSLLIWSSLPNITKISEGKLTAVKHFDGKAQVEEYIRTLPILSAFYMPGFYMQNHIAYMRPQPVKLPV